MKNWRISFIFYLVVIVGAAIIGRLFYLQVVNHKFYQAQALGLQSAFQEVVGARGEIFFKNNSKSLAINNDKWSVSVNPTETEDADVTATELAKIIKDTKENILSKINNGGSYVLIKNKLTEEEVASIRSLKLAGIHIETQSGRYYSQNKIASQVVGFLGGGGLGQYGLEGYYDNILKGEESFSQNPGGLVFFNTDNLDPSSLDGSDLYLTIDYNIQYQAESILKEAKKDFGIDAGQIIVMEPQTGKIVALANFPGFDPNQYAKEKDLGIFQNSAIQKVYELGSVLKPITVAIALNEGRISTDTTYRDEGCVMVGKQNICNFDRTAKYGTQTTTQLLEKSLNTGAVFVSQQIPHDVYLDYIDRFGFGEKTGVDLQGEVASGNSNLRNGGDVNFATASFGQGIELTPLQLITAFCPIANGGKLVRPYVVDKIVNNQREEVPTNTKIVREVITPKTSSEVTTMMISVVDNGVANKAKVPGYYIAGKTGTAQVANEGRLGYDPAKTIHSFIGFAPALNPRFIAYIKFDNPKGKSSGTTAAPAFSKLAQYILNYWQIPSDYEQ